MTAREEAEIDLVVRCTATDFPAIGKAILEAVSRMEQVTAGMGDGRPCELLVEVNAANGHLMLTWRDEGAAPLFAYVELKQLWRQSLDHAEGAGLFEREAHCAICDATEAFMHDAGGNWLEPGQERYRVFELFEWGEARRVLV